MIELKPEDAKLVTLARATRARAGASEGAAVRDLDGRTYAAASVSLPSLRLAALEVCVSMAISSGSVGLEAAVILSADPAGTPEPAGLAAVRDFGGARVPVHSGDAHGVMNSTICT